MADDAASNPSEDVVERIYADGIAMVQLLGPQDRLLRVVEREHRDVQVHVRGNEITLTGPADAVARARALVDELIALSRSGQGLDPADVVTSDRILRADTGDRPSDVLGGEAILSSRGRIIRPKTLGQKAYVDAIDENTITFGIGPAGTGKTYLAMAKAVQALQRKEVSRIILSRPAIEAGERLGFLPGTLNDKIDPYLRPLYDALNEMMDPEIVPKLMASGTIEVAPLAYMRGRTLNDSFVVLDEAQNTTPEQMKMFLTRLGFGTRMVVTGDITQIDLPAGASGLRLVTRVLKDIDDIDFSYLTSDDVVRHTLVGRIVDAYTEYDEQRLADRRERDEASAFIAARDKSGGAKGASGNRAQRRGQQSRPGGPRDHLPKRGMS
ncbi:phosphate starvation-inducible PhoH-like protein [Microbacterium lacticum]|uniref:PhoH-like protein n=2 Tax=Microbacteriaceae TaxID=85023 RepID=A0A4Y3UHZ6_9MICO|nr:phosphate starvation-inducible PhoH-like protein [Microbacterium lacticum]GEB94286.1 phosphate starvation protein PhoH [Microbacterium lacticum]GGN15991.1 phosphate starvation protein PhoH [Microbacterium lacticum]